MLKLIDMMHIAIFTALMAVLGFMPLSSYPLHLFRLHCKRLVSCWQAASSGQSLLS